MAKTDINKEGSTTEQTVTVPSNPLDVFKGKFIIKPCKKSWLEQINVKHDGLYLFEGAISTIAPERDKDTGIIKTGLTDDQARMLEKEMGLKLMELSPYSEFWSNFKIYTRIQKDGITLDLNRSAIDKVKYAYLKIHSKVALSSSDALENPRAEYVLTSTDNEAKIDSKKIRVKLDAMKVLGEMTLQEQSDFLKVYEEGKYKLGKSATADAILAKAGELVDKFPDKFLEIVQAPDYKAALFLQECMSIGAIRKSGGAYYISGGEVLGKSYQDALNNIQKPEFQEVQISLKAKISASK
tara:strand:+ start:57198 stop:58088 length:891 start_codon:yes stop_codon:yes gene_type:complete